MSRFKKNPLVREFYDTCTRSGIKLHSSQHTSELMHASYMMPYRNLRLSIIMPTGVEDLKLINTCIERSSKLCEELTKTPYDYEISYNSQHEEFMKYVGYFVDLPKISKHPLWYYIFSCMVVDKYVNLAGVYKYDKWKYSTFMNYLQARRDTGFWSKTEQWNILKHIDGKDINFMLTEYFGAITKNIYTCDDEFIKKHSWELSNLCIQMATLSLPRTVKRSLYILRYLNNSELYKYERDFVSDYIPDIDGGKYSYYMTARYINMLNSITIYTAKPWCIDRVSKKMQLLIKQEDTNNLIPAFFYNKLIPKETGVLNVIMEQKIDFGKYEKYVQRRIERDNYYQSSYNSATLHNSVSNDLDIEKCLTDKEYYNAFVGIVKYMFGYSLLRGSSQYGGSVNNVSAAKIIYAMLCLIMTENENISEFDQGMFVYMVPRFLKYYAPHSLKGVYTLKYTDISDHMVRMFLEVMADEGKQTETGGNYVPTPAYVMLLEHLDTTGCENGKILADKIKYGI